MMQRIFSIAILFAASLLAATAFADPIEELEARQTALFDQIAPSVVFITTNKGFGSGFFAAGEGLVLTAAHVVGDASKVTVVLKGGKRTTGRVIRADREADLALVQVAEKGPALPLIPVGAMRVGSWAGAIGHGEGGVWSFTSGMISNVYTASGKWSVIQTQIPINPGNSGGPVFNHRGEVVGVVFAKRTGSDGINFAVPVEVAITRFAELAAFCDCLKVQAPPGAKIFVDGRLVGSGPSLTVPLAAGEHTVMSVSGSANKKKKLNWPKVKKVDLR